MAFTRSYDLPDSPRAAALARAHTRTFVLSQRLAGLVDDATLLVSELVTNAVRHVGGRPQLTLTVDDSGLRISVTDKGTGIPVPRHPDAEHTNGRGLSLVEHLSARWGFTREPHCSTVWCELCAA